IRYFHVTGVQTCALPIYPDGHFCEFTDHALHLKAVLLPVKQLDPPVYVFYADTLASIAAKAPEVGVIVQREPCIQFLEFFGLHEIGRASCRENEKTTAIS